jgi:hypothetical protein
MPMLKYRHSPKLNQSVRLCIHDAFTEYTDELIPVYISIFINQCFNVSFRRDLSLFVLNFLAGLRSQG